MTNDEIDEKFSRIISVVSSNKEESLSDENSKIVAIIGIELISNLLKNINNISFFMQEMHETVKNFKGHQ